MSEFKGSYSTKEVLNEDGEVRKVEVSKTLPDSLEGWADQFGEDMCISMLLGEASVRSRAPQPQGIVDAVGRGNAKCGINSHSLGNPSSGLEISGVYPG